MKALFISYNGALEPIMLSQGIPYLKCLSKKGIEFVLLSFEKDRYLRKKGTLGLKDFRDELKSNRIEWHFLRYHKRPSLPATIYDIICGFIYCCYLIVSRKFAIIHARATIPAIMGFLPAKIFDLKFIFDMRGVNADEYVDAGSWPRDSVRYKVMKAIEQKLLISSQAVIVLTKKICNIIRDTKYLPKGKDVDIDIIPCCVDLEKFRFYNSKDPFLLKKYNLEGKFVFIYCGSLGTWYLLSEMLEFFNVAKEVIRNAHFLILTHNNKKMIWNIIDQKGTDRKCFTILSVEPEEMASFLSLSDVGISFIKPSFSKQASSPIKIGEYLACGLPIVVNSNVGDLEELVVDNRIGAVVRNFIRSDYLDAAEKLIELKKEANIGQRCRQAAEKELSLDMGVQRYWNIYNRLLFNH